jgi:hypothetical protein
VWLVIWEYSEMATGWNEDREEGEMKGTEKQGKRECREI